MRKLKKINGYLIVKFNDREIREWDGTGLGAYGVIDAELYTGCLDVDRSVMEYDSAETQLEAEEQARGLESEYPIIEHLPTCTVIKETEDTTEEREVEPAFMVADFEALLTRRMHDNEDPEINQTTAHHQLYGFKTAMYQLGLIDAQEWSVPPDHFGTPTATDPAEATDKITRSTAFCHLPNSTNAGMNEKIHWLGRQLETACPDDDCRIFLNTFNICREIDTQIDLLTGYPRDRMTSKLRKMYFALETMYLTNHAVRQYRQKLRSVNASQDETEKTPDEQVPCSECVDLKALVRFAQEYSEHIKNDSHDHTSQ